MKFRLLFAFCLIAAAVACRGDINVFGQRFAGDQNKARQEVEAYYSSPDPKTGKQNSILKYLADDGTWKDLTDEMLKDYAETPTYVISHGINASCDVKWITQSATAIRENDPKALVISVNWDHYSGYRNESGNANGYGEGNGNVNAPASTWINPVSDVIAEKLGKLNNIQSFVGHSYGAHLLASTMVKMNAAGNLNTGERKISFVALDPAEESLTFTGDENGNPVCFLDKNKKSKNWGLPSNVVSETYKSSGLLGSEERLGDYNYFLAAKDTITPRAVLGDLDTGVLNLKFVDNHSLADQWFAAMMENQNKNGKSGKFSVGGWFNQETDESRGQRPRGGEKGWDGVVNSTSSVNAMANAGSVQLEYRAGNEVYAEWQDLCNAEAQERLRVDKNGDGKVDKTDWEGSVLKPDAFSGYKLFHGNDQKKEAGGKQQDDTGVPTGGASGISDSDGLLTEGGAAGISDGVGGGRMATFRLADWLEKGGGLTGDDIVLDELFRQQSGMGSETWESPVLADLANQLRKIEGNDKVTPDWLNEAYEDTLGGTQAPVEIAADFYGRELERQIEDPELLQQVMDFVKDKFDEAVAKGEEWVENGGIRELVKKGLDQILDGKVTDGQKQDIMNLTDALCNVHDDGGKSLVAALQADGADLAVSLAVNELKKQLSDALPADAADTLNAMLDVVADHGTPKDIRDALLSEAQQLVTKYVPYENSAAAVNGVLQDIIDGKAIDAMDTVKDIGVSVGADALKKVLSDNLPPEVADKINNLLDGFAQDGAKGLTDAALNEIGGLIDQFAPGAESAKELKKVVGAIASGSLTGADLKSAVTSVVGDTADKLIDESNLPSNVKDAAKKAVNELKSNGLTGLTGSVQTFISDYVGDLLGDEKAGEAAGKIFEAIVTPGVDPWPEIAKQAPVIGAAIGHKIAAVVEKIAIQQIDKLIAKFPALKMVLDKLGIDGNGIVQGIKNVFSVLWNAPDLQTAMKQLGQMAVNFLKDIAAKLIDWAVEWALGWVNDVLIPKVLDWASSTLQKMADSMNFDLLRKGLEKLAEQVRNCRNSGSIKIKISPIGKKVVDKVDQWIQKNKPSKPEVVIKTGGKP